METEKNMSKQKVLNMGTVKNFEELAVWKMAREITNQIYSDFKNCKDYSFKDQVTRAGISVMNNISEGFCRSSDAESGTSSIYRKDQPVRLRACII